MIMKTQARRIRLKLIPMVDRRRDHLIEENILMSMMMRKK